MRSLFFVASLGASLLAVSAAAEDIPINSRHFDTKGFYVSDSNGDFREFHVTGFAQPAVAEIQPKFYILPQITIRPSDVRFIGENGQTFDPSIYRDRPARAIIITARSARTLPTPDQIPAIAARLGPGLNLTSVPPPLLRNQFGQIPIYPIAQSDFQIVGAINAAYANYEQQYFPLYQLANQYAMYRPELADVNELRLSLVIDGQMEAEAYMPGSALLGSGVLPELTITNPSEYLRNRIAEGTYQVRISYRFRDSATATVSASFDARQTMSNFVQETQRAVTQKKSSGWQVFHIGSRKSKIKQSLDQAVNSSFTGNRLERTVVVMNDATDDMITRFEATFFPELTRDEVIVRHERAAAEARAAGNATLAQKHDDYVAALRGSDEMKEVNAVEAAAALNEGDYAKFIAEGVRASSRSDRMTNNFRRVITSHVEINSKTEWLEAKSVSAQRETTSIIEPSKQVRQLARIGICDATPYGAPAPVGLLLTCVNARSGAHLGNLVPGMLLTSLGGTQTTSIQAMTDALADYEPGDQITARIFDPTAPGQQRSYQIRLTRGAPIESLDSY